MTVIFISPHREHENSPLLGSKCDFLQSAIEFIELVDLPDEEVSVSGSNLGVGDVDHVLVNVEVNFRSRLELSLKTRCSLKNKIVKRYYKPSIIIP